MDIQNSKYYILNKYYFISFICIVSINCIDIFAINSRNTLAVVPDVNFFTKDKTKSDWNISPNHYPIIFRPINEISPKPKQNPNSPRKATKLSLADIVVLVLANNTEIKNAYLDRIAQKEDLAVAEDKYVPDFTPTLSLSLSDLGRNTITRGALGMNLDAKVVLRIPTGGEFGFSWTGAANTSSGSSINVNNNNILNNSLNTNFNDNTFTQNLQLTFKQPLLRGAGTTINNASINIARISEQINILTLKNTLTDTITNAIFAYRELIQAQERVKIEQSSLQNATESLKVTQALIDAGRIAPVDIVQNETDIANRKVNLLEAQNELEAKKLALLAILDIEKSTNIEAEAISAVKPTQLDFENLKKIAFETQANFLISQLNVERTKIDFLVASDARRWDLSLDARLENRTNVETDVRAGLTLTRQLGDLTINQRFERARVDVKKSENTLKDARSRLEIALQDNIRNVNLSFSRLELARQATKLSERQLDIEQQKRSLGRGADIFQLITLQNQLAVARNIELQSTINYLNALTNLDKLLGTTLQTWQITVEK
ncbi:MAG: TolC family protein [Scytonematopsis contorta HA4267-MV1]|jgi:outer membrane protein TolC|nr:TolC family protein [Scytonematopsis contorta HA4267-MV1]